MRLSEIIVEHGDKWERDSDGNGIGWGFKDDEREARKYGYRTGDRSGPGNKLLAPDEAGKMYGDSLDGAEELEEIKVTKTVAGKRASASQTLAGKLKKKKPNQGKKPVELHKMKDAKELANNLLKGQYKS